MHTIAQSNVNSSYKVGSFMLNSLQMNVRMACPHLPNGGYKHFPTCTDSEGKQVHSTFNNIKINPIISEGVDVSSAIILLANPLSL